MSVALILGSAGLTAGAMALAAWGLSFVDIAGPRPLTRIALLVPPMEVTALLLWLPIAAQALAAERSPALRRALATVAHGRRLAIVRSSRRLLSAACRWLAGGAIPWLLLTLLPGGPSLGQVAQTRLALLSFALFAVGLGLYISARFPTALAAGAGTLIALGMLAVVPLAVAPVLSVFGTSRVLVQGTALLSPWVVIGGIAGLDIVHMQWVYALSPLGHVELTYPGLLSVLVTYTALGGASWLAAAAALRVGRTAPGSWR